MSIFKIEITEECEFRNEIIMTATVSNGNWRAWESWQDTTEEQPLTLNTIGNFADIHNPIKAVFPNFELENGELVKNGEEVRLYESLIDFLSIVLGWCKDRGDYKREFDIIICEFRGSYTKISKKSTLNYESERKATVIVEKVE